MARNLDTRTPVSRKYLISGFFSTPPAGDENPECRFLTTRCGKVRAAAIRAAAINSGAGLFYYSGHGLQVGGKNYMIPLAADIKSERYVAVETLDVDSVLA